MFGFPSSTAFQPSFTSRYSIVLHRLGPVVHEVLIHVVRIEQLGLLEGFEQILGERDDQCLGLVANRYVFQDRRLGRLPLLEKLRHRLVEGCELGCPKMVCLDFRLCHLEHGISCPVEGRKERRP